MSISRADAPQWPIDAMTASERRGLRAVEHEHRQAPTREAFLADIAQAKAKHDARERQAQRARNSFHLTDKGVTWLLAVPSGVIGGLVLLFTVFALLFTDWL